MLQTILADPLEQRVQVSRRDAAHHSARLRLAGDPTSRSYRTHLGYIPLSLRRPSACDHRSDPLLVVSAPSPTTALTSLLVKSAVPSCGPPSVRCCARGLPGSTDVVLGEKGRSVELLGQDVTGQDGFQGVRTVMATERATVSTGRYVPLPARRRERGVSGDMLQTKGSMECHPPAIKLKRPPVCLRRLSGARCARTSRSHGGNDAERYGGQGDRHTPSNSCLWS